MLVTPKISINDGNLVVHGKTILTGVPDNIVLTPGSVCLGFGLLYVDSIEFGLDQCSAKRAEHDYLLYALIYDLRLSRLCNSWLTNNYSSLHLQIHLIPSLEFPTIGVATFIALGFALLVFSVYSAKALSFNYYDHTCPQAESIVSRTVKIQEGYGCDASVLLNSTSKNQTEKDGPPNISLHAFYIIDIAKEEIEDSCLGVASCAAILAFAAKGYCCFVCHVYHQKAFIPVPTKDSGVPTWDMPKGSLDGRISQSFAQRGLSLDDLVALSGGHTLGFSHYSSFQNRVHNFDTANDIDPTMQAEFAESPQSVCPIHKKEQTWTQLQLNLTMPTSSCLGKSSFSSDQALLTNPKTKALVSKYACSLEEFEKAFVKAMIRMSSITGGEEIRYHFRVLR
ncbi:hem peroxidase [Dillenia turbinata]|uniref:Peroxidase n=1 Tax=Dillenia turbinata TaxID=194707 RepID=A0AAN8W0S3_9MAGN